MKIPFPRSRRSLPLSGLLLGMLGGVHAQSVQLLPLAEDGQSAGGGLTYNGTGAAFLGPTGRAAIVGSVTGPGVTALSNTVIGQGSPGAMTVLAREGDTLPGLVAPQTLADNVTSLLSISPAGTATFEASINPTPATSFGIWTGNGGLSALAVSGQPDPAGTTVLLAGNHSGNDLGSAAWFSVLTGAGVTSSSNVGLYTNYSGAAALIGRESSPVPGQPVGTSFDDMGNGAGAVVLTNQNYVVHQSSVFGGGYAAPRNGAIWSRDPASGNYTAMMTWNDPAPGAGAGVRFRFANGYTPNDNNDVLFSATLLGGTPAVTAANDTGVWFKAAAGSPVKIAQEGDAAIGVAGAVHSTFEELFLSNNGVRAVVGLVSGAGITTANDRCIWTDNGGGLGLVVQEGVTIFTLPNCGGPVLSYPVRVIESVQMNLNGELLVQATLNDAASTRGIWMIRSGAVYPFLAKNDPVFDSTDTLRVIATVRVSKQFGFNAALGNGPIGRMRAFNESNQSALLIQHSGGSGSYLVRIITLLEPIAVGLQEAADVPGAQWKNIFQGVTINRDDLVAFRGDMVVGLGGVTATSSQGIWAQDANEVVKLVARQGSEPVGVTGGVLSSLALNPAWNDNETVAWAGEMQTGGGFFTPGPGGVTYFDRFGLWKTVVGGATSLIARSGTTTVVPELPAGTRILSFSGIPAINNSDQIVARGSLVKEYVAISNSAVTSLTDSFVLRFSPTPALLAREGDMVSGALGAVTLGECSGTSYLFHNNAGVTAFRAPIQNVANSGGIFVHNGSALSVWLATGHAAPATVGQSVLDPGQPALSQNGWIATTATVGLPGLGQVLYLGAFNGAPAPIAITGVPQSAGTFGPVGIHPDAMFGLINDPVISDTGDIAFRAELVVGAGGVTVNDNVGIWHVVGGNLTLLTRTGNFAPNGTGGVTANPFTRLSNPSIGTAGRVGFTGQARGKIAFYVNSEGDPLCPSLAGLRLVVQPGDVLNIPTAPDPAKRNVIAYSIFHERSDVYPNLPLLPSQQLVFGSKKACLSIGFLDATSTSGAFTVLAP